MKEQYNKNNLVEQPYGHYPHQYQNRNPEMINSELGFSPEDVAYVVDVILDYMKEYEKVMFKN